MVNSSSVAAKSLEKLVAAKVNKTTQSPGEVTARVSPGGTFHSLEQEVTALRARNKALTDVIKTIKDTAHKEEKRLYDLVWFARNRTRYPNHESRHRIQNTEEYKEELAKLCTGDGDFVHGMHTGLLAAARLFKDYSDVLHVNERDEISGELLNAFGEHMKEVSKRHQDFPKVNVDLFPED